MIPPVGWESEGRDCMITSLSTFMGNCTTKNKGGGKKFFVVNRLLLSIKISENVSQCKILMFVQKTKF